MKQLLMGNEAIGLGAIKAGVNLVTGYPGTPSTEILETIAKNNDGSIYIEWSANEKVAMEIAAGASYSGARTLVTMKQVGLNVASDPLMSLTYIGTKGGMVIVVADDPGPISSQTEQDTRHFAQFAKLPIFDPTSPEEAYLMINDAFNYSEKYNTPVLFRPTTRICHACSSIEIEKEKYKTAIDGFEKSSRWVIFPKLAFENHRKIEQNLVAISNEFNNYKFNEITGSGKKGIVTSGISYSYCKEALNILNTNPKLFKITTPHPFPEKLALYFLDGLDEVLVIEELDPIIEKELIFICGKYNLNINMKGKLSNHTPNAGENNIEILTKVIAKFLDINYNTLPSKIKDIPLPIRPPVLCAGCPHRASFYAVKKAMKDKKAVFSGDIGCYTLGNAKPLDMVDTCLCMGAGITVAQGIHRIEPDTINFAFIGDSTFFHTGIVGVVNAIYNETDIVLIVLDNSTTAMTGHQPHPGTGKTMMGNISNKINIEEILKSLGVKYVKKINPLNLDESIKTVKEATNEKGVSAIIFKSPCIAVTKPKLKMKVDNDKCRGCKLCINELGCPAIIFKDKKAIIEPSMCYGCTLCSQVCPFNAIV